MDIGGRSVRVTNPDKVVFPDAGVTKLALIEYYLAVADGALRGVAGRPMVLKRFVKGISEEAVFQKRAPEKRPEWIDVAELKYASGTSAKEAVIDGRGRPGMGGEPRLRRPESASRFAPTIWSTPTSCESTSIRCPAWNGRRSSTSPW